MAPVALTFAVLDASGSTSQLGLVLAARMVPMLAFSLVGVATVLVAEPAGSDLDSDVAELVSLSRALANLDKRSQSRSR
jgi:hypothetical protein